MPVLRLAEADRIRLTRAFGFAASWHRLDGGAIPAGDSAPYLAQLLQHVGLALEYGGSVGLAVAALVHQGPGWATRAGERAERAEREGTIGAPLSAQLAHYRALANALRDGAATARVAHAIAAAVGDAPRFVERETP